MERTCSDLLDKVRGLAAARDLLDRALDEAVADAVASGMHRGELARALGVHRATFYRQFVTGREAS